MEKESDETIEEFGSISALHGKVSHGQNKKNFWSVGNKVNKKKQGEEQQKENSFMIFL